MEKTQASPAVADHRPYVLVSGQTGLCRGGTMNPFFHRFGAPWFCPALGLFLLIATSNLGCSGESSSPGKPTTESGQKISNLKNVKKEGSDARNDEVFDSGLLLNAKYRVSAVIKNAGNEKGRCGPQTFSLKVNNAFIGKEKELPLFEVPNAVLQCKVSPLNLQVSLAQILGVFTDKNATPSLKVENHVIFVDRLGDGFYKSWRPLMPSFFASTPEELGAIYLNIEGLELKTKLNDASDVGNIRLRTLSVGRSETVPAGTFPNVLSYETLTSGFDDPKVVKIMNFLFDRMEWHISLNPFAIIAIKFETTATQLGKAATYNPGTVDGLPGKVLQSSQWILENIGFVRGITEDVANQFKVEITMELEEQEGITQ